MTLFPHQEEGAQALAGKRRLYLGDEPGTGKTHTAARALSLAGVRAPLVVCPAIARTHWVQVLCEFGYSMDDKWRSALSYDAVVHGGDSHRESA